MSNRSINVYRALSGEDINQPLEELKTPSNFIPSPSNEDYDLGYINRYFVKKINSDLIYETSVEDYDLVDVTFWQRTSLKWKITGPRYTNGFIEGVEPYNNKQISSASKEIDEIKKLLTNPYQFGRF